MIPTVVAFKGAMLSLDPGQSGTVEFVVDKIGTFWYICPEPDATYSILSENYYTPLRE